jgi:hypothetical protein
VETDDAAPLSGAAYVFVRKGTLWAEQAFLKPELPEHSEGFGWRVALDGDRLAIAARDRTVTPSSDGAAQARAGVVYTYQREQGRWRLQARLHASQPSAHAQFGWALSVSGNWLAVGAPGADSTAGDDAADGGVDAFATGGAVYLFEAEDDQWLERAVVRALDGSPEHAFGRAVSLSGDTLAVGAPRWTAVEAPNTLGAAFLYERRQNTWEQFADLRGVLAASGGEFGADLALDERTLVVGAPLAAAHAGVVSVFERESDRWQHVGNLAPVLADQEDRFGSSVAVGGGLVLVGAPGEDGSATYVDGPPDSNDAPDIGAAYVFNRGSELSTPVDH